MSVDVSAVLPRAGLVLALTVTTMAVFERAAQVGSAQLALSPPALLAALVVAWCGLLLVLFRLRRRIGAAAAARPRALLGGALVLWIVAVVGFAGVYPVVDSGRLGFESDREEAIDVGVRALLRGEFPYACRAVSGVHDGCPETGNPIGPWPGAFVLAAPAVLLLGGAGWLSLLSLPLLVWAISRDRGEAGKGALFLAGLVFAAPIIPAEIITGGDLLANALLVLCPLLLLVQDPRRRGATCLALWLGVALSWRGLLWMVVPPVLASFLARGRRAEVLRPTAIALGAFLAVTLPLLLWRPQQFTPWQVQQKLSLFTDLLPQAHRIFPLLGLLLGLALGWRARSPGAVLNAAGWAVLVPVLGAVVLYSLRQGYPSCSFYGWYALAALPFFAVATWIDAGGAFPESHAAS